MMKITISEKTFSDRFEKRLNALKLDKYIRIVDPNEKNTFQISINQNEDSISVECDKLNFYENISDEKEIETSVLKCCGFKKIQLKGMSVRDSNNVKIKPVIDIFIKESHLFQFPEILEFTKISFFEKEDNIESHLIHFDSEILDTILETTNLFFEKYEMFFKLSFERNQHFIKYKKPQIALCMDFLFNTTESTTFSKHQEIIKKHRIFENFLNGKVENLVFSKNFYKKIANNQKELEDMMDFVQHAPKFQDGRDDIISELKEFLVENYPFKNEHKFGYLEVYKQHVPKNKNKHSLKKFIDVINNMKY